jgi:hypothetical protein
MSAGDGPPHEAARHVTLTFAVDKPVIDVGLAAYSETRPFGVQPCEQHGYGPNLPADEIGLCVADVARSLAALPQSS